MIDPMISLAMAMHSNPGVYAVLLGSGVSRAARIPTGWEMVLELIRKVAHLAQENCEPKPEVWYEEKYGKKPTYSGLLEVLGNTGEERSTLLKKYFEPTEEDMENGGKQPTKAHHALAQMVKQKYVRVILTTNFDRLMEQALAAAGVTYTAISHPDAIKGALPLVHAECTVIKLHGDYTDLRTKNTPEELGSYTPEMDEYLDRVLDEYGLIVSGWSADWDEALCKAMLRRANRRFTTWWTTMGDLSEKAKQIADFAQAQEIRIVGADSFFEELSEKLSALSQFEKPHPLSAAIAVAQTKKYLSEPKYRIPLSDLVSQEIEKIMEATSEEHYPLNGTFSDDDFSDRIVKFEAISEIAMRIAATGCFWDEGKHLDIWIRAIERLLNPPRVRGNDHPGMLAIRLHLARLVLYACGISYTARSDFKSVYAVLSKPICRAESPELPIIPALELPYPPHDWFKTLPGLKNNKVAVSVHLFNNMRAVFLDILPGDKEYQEAFDMYEILQSFHCIRACRPHWHQPYAMPGLFMCRQRNGIYPNTIQKLMKEGTLYEILGDAGFCDASKEEFDNDWGTLDSTTGRISNIF